MKNKLFNLLFLSITLFFAGCIQNDIPYPVIKGEVVKFSVRGEKECVIDKEQRIIKVILADSVDIRKVKINELAVSEGASTDFDISQPIDATKPIKFMVTTYQQYQWTIEISQPIERKVLFENQVGDPKIDVTNRTVVVDVAASQDIYNINVIEMKLGPSISTISPDPKTVKNFSRPQSFIVSYFEFAEEWRVFVIPTQVTVSTSKAQPWGVFAHLSGSIQAGTTDVPAFEIRKKSDSEWQLITGADVVVDGSRIKAKANGLTPSTAYVYRAKLGSNIGNEVEFTTEATPTIANLFFEEGYMSGKTWYPNKDGGNSFWATGNEGVTSTLAGGKNSNTSHTDDAVTGKAVRLETIAVPVVQIAAGNIFTGTYKTVISNPKASAVMGRPYTGRPTKLTGWYKYAPMPINVDKDNKYPAMKDKSDFGQVYLRLENWGTATVRPSKPEVIAYGEFKTDQLVSQYTKFQFDVVYTNTELTPTHICLVATASIYGEDFCGGVGSVMYVDDFSLIFE